jgi:DnaJ like chaperone protein
MPEFPDLRTIVVVVVAFIIGYYVLSFIIYVLRGGRTGENTAAGGAETRSHGFSQSERNGETAKEGRVRDEAFYASVLGLPYNYTVEEIRSRYLKLAAQYHPDKVNHLGPKLRSVAEEEMKQINEAYLYFRHKYNI